MSKVTGIRAVVVGGAGFIGSHVCDCLLSQGANVVVIDDFSSGRPENLAHHDSNSALRIEKADIRDEKSTTSLLRGAEIVFHLATRNVRRSLRQPTEVHEVNTTGTLNLLKAASAANVDRFVYCSSSEVVGNAGSVRVGEDVSFDPKTIYGASKLAGEYYARVFNNSGWLQTVVARPFNAYGPREHYAGPNGEVIPRFILWALSGKAPVVFGDGRQTRDFTYVIETARILVALGLHKNSGGQTFNICRGEEVSILDVARQISELTGLNAEPIHAPGRPNDLARLWGDSSQLERFLGSGPRISIPDGLERTVAWFRTNVPLTEATLASLGTRNWEDVVPEPWLEAKIPLLPPNPRTK